MLLGIKTVRYNLLYLKGSAVEQGGVDSHEDKNNAWIQCQGRMQGAGPHLPGREPFFWDTSGLWHPSGGESPKNQEMKGEKSVIYLVILGYSHTGHSTWTRLKHDYWHMHGLLTSLWRWWTWLQLLLSCFRLTQASNLPAINQNDCQEKWSGW